MRVEVVRSGLVESVHQVAVAVSGRDGRLVAWAGDVDRPFFFRSAAKPFQATVSQRLGAGLSLPRLAVAAASHDGEPVHVAHVSAMLAEAGLGVDALSCPPDWPVKKASDRLVAAGERSPRSLWHNCSGKHAAMLRACLAQGWDPARYLDPDHPLQREIAAEMIEVAGEGCLPVGVDGCGAPSFRASVRSMAAGFARLAADPAYGEVVTAMHRYPALASGAGNPDAAIATALFAVAKRGAEGCLAVGLPGRGAIAVKAWDGSMRAAGPAAAATLDRLGWIPEGSRLALAPLLEPTVAGGSGKVGTVRAVVELRTP